MTNCNISTENVKKEKTSLCYNPFDWEKEVNTMDKEKGNPKGNQNRPDPKKSADINQKKQENMLSGIRRVSADSNVSKAQQPAKAQAPSHPSKAPVHKPESPNHHVSGTRRTIPPRKSKEEIRRRKRNAAILLGTAAILILALIGTGIFFLVKHFSGEKKTTLTTVTSTETTTLATSEETTSEVTTSETTEMTTTAEPTATPTPATTPFPAGGPNLNGYCVVIDAGHQEVANLSQEAMSDSMGGSKAKSAEGFSGVISGINESEINLSVELLLKSYLESLGCEVYVTRESNDVDISNKERAQFAVSHDPDLYIRLFCNAANDSATNGCEVIVPSGGKYASEVMTWGENLGKNISVSSGSAFNGCKQSGSYSGLNWAQDVPAFMVRMGYLSNSDEEAKLLKEEYQFTICQGIAQFISTMPRH